MTKGTERRQDRREDRRDGGKDESDDGFDIEDLVDLTRNTSLFEKYIRSTLAECIGTMGFTFIACMATTTMDVTMIAFAEGLAMAVLCAGLLNVSGGHFNPATTFAASLAGQIHPGLGILYILAQLGGAVMGAGFVMAVLLDESYDEIKGGCNDYRGLVPYDKYDADRNLDVTEFTATVIEAFLGTAIYLVYLMANVDRKSKHPLGPLAYGFALVASIMVAYNCSGGSFNPARSFGPALVAEYWDEHFIYWAGPMTGGLIAGVLYRLFFAERKKRLLFTR